MSEETASALVCLFYPKNGEPRHSQRTDDCPDLTDFSSIVTKRWPSTQLDHIRSGCIYCEKVLVMGLRCDHPVVPALVQLLTLLGGSNTLEDHLELDDCRICRRLYRTEFVQRRVAAWKRRVETTSYLPFRVAPYPRAILSANLHGPAAVGHFSAQHETDDGKLLIML